MEVEESTDEIRTIIEQNKKLKHSVEELIKKGVRNYPFINLAVCCLVYNELENERIEKELEAKKVEAEAEGSEAEEAEETEEVEKWVPYDTKNMYAIIKFLVACGYNMDIVYDGELPIMRLMSGSGISYKVIELLVKHGCTIPEHLIKETNYDLENKKKFIRLVEKDRKERIHKTKTGQVLTVAAASVPLYNINVPGYAKEAHDRLRYLDTQIATNKKIFNDLCYTKDKKGTKVARTYGTKMKREITAQMELTNGLINERNSLAEKFGIGAVGHVHVPSIFTVKTDKVPKLTDPKILKKIYDYL